MLQALICANEEDSHQIICNTNGIIFLGTPHRGSQITVVANIWYRLSSLLGYPSATALLKTLAYSSEELEELDHRFLSLTEIKKLLFEGKIVCFFETKGLSLFGVSV